MNRGTLFSQVLLPVLVADLLVHAVLDRVDTRLREPGRLLLLLVAFLVLLNLGRQLSSRVDGQVLVTGDPQLKYSFGHFLWILNHRFHRATVLHSLLQAD